MTIRPVVPDDAAPLRDLRLQALANNPVAFAADYAMTESQGVAAWAERIAEDIAQNHGVIHVATASGAFVGMTGLGRGRWPKERHIGVIWGVYVAPEWRALGIAHALLEACLAWARVQELSIVKLGVVTTNTPAIRCYVRCGFAVYGVDPKVLLYEGAFYDELLMAKGV